MPNAGSSAAFIAMTTPLWGELIGHILMSPLAISLAATYIFQMSEEKQPAQADAAASNEDKVKSETPETTTGKNRALWTGAAVGIGSAAIVAALLYANKRRK